MFPHSLPSRYRRKSLSLSDTPGSPQMSIASLFHPHSPPYSPPPSSSPPPCSPFSVSSHHHAYIHTSPRIPFEHGFSIPDIDESLAFDPRAHCSHSKSSPHAIRLPSFSASFPSDDELPFAFEDDAYESSDSFSVDNMHLSSRYKTKPKRSPFRIRTKLDRDDLEDLDAETLSDDARGTYFSVSAERGRWRNDPLVIRPRMSLPTTVSLPPRSRSNIGDSTTADGMESTESVKLPVEASYPSPPTTSVPSDLAVSETSNSLTSQHADTSRPPSRSQSPASPFVTSVSPVNPPLTTDTTSPISPAHRGSSLSPLPSSSIGPSPIPMSISLPSSEPVSPLSLTMDLPDDPNIVLSKINDEIASDGESMELEVDDDYFPSQCSPMNLGKCGHLALKMDDDETTSPIFESPQPDCFEQVSRTVCPPAISHLPTPCPSEPEHASIKSELPCLERAHDIDQSPIRESPAGEPSTLPPISDRSQSLAMSRPTSSSPDIFKADAVDGCEDLSQSSQDESSHAYKVKKRTKRREKEASSSDESVDGQLGGSCPISSTKTKQRKSLHQRQESGGPRRKRSRILRVIEDKDEELEREEASCAKHVSSSKDISEWGLDDHGAKEKRVRRRRKEDHKGGDKENKARRRISASSKRGLMSDDDFEPKRPAPMPLAIESVELRTEMQGMLIESMATSRASSLPVSSLCRTILQSRPALASQRSERQWLKQFESVLEDGWKGSGVFGKVDSSGKDDSGRALEAQWFYVPERDEDQERATLIRSMMPRPAKRSETKKYKQYYYRPLEKMSRWDPEDEM